MDLSTRYVLERRPNIDRGDSGETVPVFRYPEYIWSELAATHDNPCARKMGYDLSITSLINLNLSKIRFLPRKYRMMDWESFGRRLADVDHSSSDYQNDIHDTAMFTFIHFFLIYKQLFP